MALGLPWFESMNALGQSLSGKQAAKPSEAPRRIAALFMGNGVNPHHWGAEPDGAGMRLKDSLRPLEPFKDKLLVFQGLWNPTTVEGPGGHFPKMNVLAGVKVKQTTTDVAVGVTMDQMIAREVGRHTPVQSLTLGTEGPGYSTDSGYTSLYSAYISWASPTAPAPKEIYPQQAFDQLFDDGSKRKRNRIAEQQKHDQRHEHDRGHVMDDERNHEISPLVVIPKSHLFQEHLPCRSFLNPGQQTLRLGFRRRMVPAARGRVFQFAAHNCDAFDQFRNSLHEQHDKSDKDQCFGRPLRQAACIARLFVPENGPQGKGAGGQDHDQRERLCKQCHVQQ